MNNILQFLTDSIKYPINSIGAISALISVASTLITYYSKLIVEKKKLKEAQESQFQIVLESNSLADLGSYLDDVIGKFQIREYGENEAIRKKVNAYLEKIQDLVGTNEDIQQEAAIEQPPELPSQFIEAIPSQFQSVYNELQTGEPWNALAKLRRIIEGRLFDLAGAADIKVTKRYGAGHVLKLIAERKLIDHNTIERLRFAISLANKAIHGENVSFDDARMAIHQAVIALDELDNQQNEMMNRIRAYNKGIETDAE